MIDFIIQNWEIIASLLGLSGLGTSGFMFYRQDRQSKELDNVTKQMGNISQTNTEWKSIADERQEMMLGLQEKLDEKDKKIDSLYEELNKERERARLAEEEAAKKTSLVGMYQGAYCKNYTCQQREPSLEELIKMAKL